MYLKHFGFNEFPFSLAPSQRFFCSLAHYKDALNVVMVGLENGEGFIKIIGEVGTGKTTLCRRLLNTLGDEYVTAYINNVPSSVFELQKSLAYELEIGFADDVGQHKLLTLINNHLIELYKQGKRVVVIVDEAHSLSDRVLEGLRLLSNLETETNKLLQIVLFGQPELDKRLRRTKLRQLDQRIVFSYLLPSLRNYREGLSYICFRLSAAGYHDSYDTLFSPRAVKLLLKASKGIPRVINILAHKSLLMAYGFNKSRVGSFLVKSAIADTGSISRVISYKYLAKITIISALLTTILGLGSYLIFR